MYKIVLVSLLALAVAEPEPEPSTLISSYGAPLAYSSWISPATTTITKSASSVVHPSPYLYSSPYYGHFIKKRSPGALYAGNYISPYAYNTYNSQYAAPALATPVLQSAPIWSSPALTYAGAPAHFIKKRSVAALSPTYITPTTYAASAPLLTSTYASVGYPIYNSAPLTYTSPFGYSHFIKKRSVGVPYYAPATYSYSASAPLLTSTYTAGAPILSAPASYISASPYYGYSTYIKK